jgi:hypothetical protein
MTHTNKELAELWKNDAKRREFLKTYRDWGVWITTPELGLTYYRYDLPEGSKILAMEYRREIACRYGNEEKYQTLNHFYLWTEELFVPHFASESEITDRLKRLKVDIQKELRAGADAK